MDISKKQVEPIKSFNPPKAKCACGKEAMDGQIQCWDCIHRK